MQFINKCFKLKRHIIIVAIYIYAYIYIKVNYLSINKIVISKKIDK